MKAEIKNILLTVLYLILSLTPLFVPPWTDETGFMPIDQFFSAFYPGQWVTTPLFGLLAILLISKIVNQIIDRRTDTIQKK